MFISDLSIKRPVFTTMVTIGLMVLGVLATRNIGVDMFPDVSFPIVTVTTVYPGAGPQEVEQLVSRQIEEAVASSNGVDEVRSYSRDSVSMVVVMFKLETDVKAAATDVRERVAGIRRNLPRDVQEPLIQRVDPTALPVLTYAVSSARNPAETRRLVEDVIKPRIESVDGVASVKVTGGQEREIKVWFRARALEQLGLSLTQVAQQLGQEGFDLPGGRMVEGSTEMNVKTAGRYRSLDELRNVVVATTQPGAQIRLADVADVVDGYKEVRTRPMLDGQDAVTFEVQKQGGSNTVAIADLVYKQIERLEKSAALPSDVKLLKVVDASVFIRQNVADVTESIVFGGAMAILVIFLFMLDWRSTLISSLALPTSVVTTFLAMWWLGFTFNMMSLLGLSLAIGLLIDDAVVVRENIYRHMELGEDPITAARKGTSEIGLAVMATTFTIVAVFVPVAFMGGMVGKMFKQFGLTVASAVLVSLFISFTLDPMMSARVMKPIEPGHHEAMRHHRIFGRIFAAYESLDRYYRGLLEWALNHRWTVVAGATVMFVASMALTPLMGKEFFSPMDRGEFRVNLELPAGTSLERTTEVTHQVEALIRGNPEVRRLFTTIAPSEEAHKSSIRVYTTKKYERSVSQPSIQADLRKRIAGIPGLTALVADIQMIEGPAVEMPFTLFVRGDDYEKLQRVSAEALEILKGIRGIADADSSFRGGKRETNVVVNRPAANDRGVSVGVLATTVRMAVEGDVVAKFRDGDRDHDVRVQLRPDDRLSMESLASLTVPATGRKIGSAPGDNPMAALAAMAQGPRLVRLSDVARLEPGTGPATIERQNRQRQIILTANTAGRSLGEVVAEFDAKVEPLRSEGVALVHGGATQRMQETFENMGLALLVAVLFIYFVLASQFESFIHPVTIMISLPLAVVGAFLLLFLADEPIGMPAMIGIILLMGLVTKNAILLVDYTRELRDEGMPMQQALLTAGPTRLRPILMTSAAMVLGMLPTAIGRGEGSEFRAPMALAVIGGVITSTFLTLLVVPIVYTWLDRFTTRGRKSAPPAPRPKVVSEPEPKTAVAAASLSRTAEEEA